MQSLQIPNSFPSSLSSLLFFKDLGMATRGERASSGFSKVAVAQSPTSASGLSLLPQHYWGRLRLSLPRASPEPPSLLPGPSRAPALVSCTGQGTVGPLGLAREVWDFLGDGVGVVLPVLVPPPDLAHRERTGEMGTLQAAFSWPC